MDLISFFKYSTDKSEECFFCEQLGQYVLYSISVTWFYHVLLSARPWWDSRNFISECKIKQFLCITIFYIIRMLTPRFKISINITYFTPPNKQQYWLPSKNMQPLELIGPCSLLPSWSPCLVDHVTPVNIKMAEWHTYNSSQAPQGIAHDLNRYSILQGKE